MILNTFTTYFSSEFFLTLEKTLDSIPFQLDSTEDTRPGEYVPTYIYIFNYVVYSWLQMSATLFITVLFELMQLLMICNLIKSKQNLCNHQIPKPSNQISKLKMLSFNYSPVSIVENSNQFLVYLSTKLIINYTNHLERSIRKWVLWISFYNIKFKSIYLPSY